MIIAKSQRSVDAVSLSTRAGNDQVGVATADIGTTRLQQHGMHDLRDANRADSVEASGQRAILAIDAVGYSSLMGEDEPGRLGRCKNVATRHVP